MGLPSDRFPLTIIVLVRKFGAQDPENFPKIQKDCAHLHLASVLTIFKDGAYVVPDTLWSIAHHAS
jgi:hypothetical protein